MAHYGGKENCNASQFFITLRAEELVHFENHTVIGEVVEGIEVLEKINKLYCDEEGRPYQDVRLLHTYILDDPYGDPPGLESRGLVPPSSPERDFPPEEVVKRRIPYEPEETKKGLNFINPGSFVEEIIYLSSFTEIDEEEMNLLIKRKEAKSRAIVLEMTGDLPDAEVKPPDEVIFVCKLNPVTTDEDLELIFSRFGKIKSCEVIRDHKTGDSLNYAFIEFETEASCIQAYEKMNNVLIDDRRIKVDFSQSVSKLWNRYLLKPRNANNSKDGKGKGKGKENEGRGVSRREDKSSAASHYQHQPVMGRDGSSNRPFASRDNERERERQTIKPALSPQKIVRGEGPKRSSANSEGGNERRERDRERSRSRPRSVSQRVPLADRPPLPHSSLRSDSRRHLGGSSSSSSPPHSVFRSESRLRSVSRGRDGYRRAEGDRGREEDRERERDRERDQSRKRPRNDEPIRHRRPNEFTSSSRDSSFISKEQTRGEVDYSYRR